MSEDHAPPPAPPPIGAGTPLRVLRHAPEQREMALIVGLALFLNLAPGTLLQWLHFRWGIFLTQILFIAAPPVLAVRWFYLDRASVLPLRRPGWNAVGAALLGAAGLNHLLNLAGAWQERIFPMPDSLRLLWERLLTPHGGVDYALLLLLLGPLPAICEEILFRGFLQAGFVQAFESPGKGILMTALVFAAFHLDPWRFAGVLVLGLFLGYLVHRSGSLLPAMLAHALNNILSIVQTDPSASGSAPGSPGSAAVAVILVLVALALLRRSASWTGATRVL
ncbi:MAG TPA: CPBP family intramembrane glutamic endopeptidase [Candidatus Polarisedimenticolia bacterium]|nr:CPBP family intramembrane glutamic endopeptidase [Candidatus Polarisedimenticolia bacterium]